MIFCQFLTEISFIITTQPILYSFGIGDFSLERYINMYKHLLAIIATIKYTT